MTRTRQRRRQLCCESLETRQMLSLANYYVVNAQSGKVLDDPGFATGTAVIQQYQLNGGTNQQWSFDKQASQTTITNVFSKQYLQVPSYSQRNGTEIEQNRFTGFLTQDWKFVHLSDGNYEIVNAVTTWVMDDPSGSSANHTQIQEYPWNGGLNQQWILIQASARPTEEHVISSWYSGRTLDEPPGTPANGTHTQLAAFTGSANQEWLVVYLADGYEMIVNAASGMVLDNPWGNANHNPINVYQVNGGYNQQWLLVIESGLSVAPPNRHYAIINESAGVKPEEVLTDARGLGMDPSSVIQYPWLSGERYQIWKLS